MVAYVPNRSAAAFAGSTDPQTGLQWDPYPQYLGPAELNSALDEYRDTVLNSTYASRELWVPRKSKGSRTIVIGSSIEIGSDTATQLRGSWFSRACAYSRQRMQFVRNAGRSGDNTTQMLSRLAADVIAYAPDKCIIGGPTNDHNQQFTAAQTRANIGSMVTALLAAGIEPVLCTCAPVDVAGNGPDYDTPDKRRGWVQRYNAWLRAYAARNGFMVIDLYAPLAEVTTGGYKAGYSADGLHPNVTGQAAAAAYIADNLPDTFPGGGPYLIDSAVATYGVNMMPGGLFDADSNADGLADGWTLSGASITAKALIADSAVPGNWQELTSTAPAQSQMQQAAITTSGFAEGDRIAVASRYTVSGGTSLVIAAFAYGVNITYQAIGDWAQDATDQVAYMEIALPAGVAGLSTRVGLTGAGTARVAQMTMVNLTALGIA